MLHLTDKPDELFAANLAGVPVSTAEIACAASIMGVIFLRTPTTPGYAIEACFRCSPDGLLRRRRKRNSGRKATALSG
jgi:hypothetical protein